MNKLMYIVGGLAVVGLIYFSFFFKRCEPPTEEQVKSAALMCIFKLSSDPSSLRQGICKALERPFPCDLQESDREKAQEYLTQTLTKCVEKDLASQNLCTDKVKELLQ